MSDYIPDELLQKILTYLPAKSLVRFASVCKSWKSLITSSDFITNHLNQTRASNNNNNHLLLLRYCTGKVLDNELISLYIDNDTFNLCENLNFPFQSVESKFRVYGYCNGLILLSNGILSKNALMLWNPSIGKSLTLPRFRYMYLKHIQAFGFGFDSRTNDFKVVRLVYQKSKGKVYSKVELYKLSTRSWETITAAFDPSCIAYTKYLGQAFLNGAVHWSANKMGTRMIMSFNMRDEEFSELKLPPNLYMRSYVDIVILGEWLSLFHIPHFDSHCSVWAMKEYGVVESWTKLYTLDLHPENWSTPLGFRKNGELLLRKRCGELFSYDSETQLIKYIGNSYTCRPSCLNICKFKACVDAYVESLVLFGAANRLGAGPAKQAKKKRKNRQDIVFL